MPSLLDEALKVGQDLEKAESRLRGLQGQIDQAQKRLEETTQAAEVESRQILQKARDSAAVLLKGAEEHLHLATRKMAEVVAREKAVSWVDEEQKKLEAKARELANSEKQTEKTRASALAAEKLYTDKLKELKDWEVALEKKELSLKTSHPEPESKKTTKKG